VLGIEAVMPDGEVSTASNACAKDNTGYDLKQLLIGAEGYARRGLARPQTVPRHAQHAAAMMGWTRRRRDRPGPRQAETGGGVGPSS
jgi:hypothetical protein